MKDVIAQRSAVALLRFPENISACQFKSIQNYRLHIKMFSLKELHSCLNRYSHNIFPFTSTEVVKGCFSDLRRMWEEKIKLRIETTRLRSNVLKKTCVTRNIDMFCIHAFSDRSCNILPIFSRFAILGTDIIIIWFLRSIEELDLVLC